MTVNRKNFKCVCLAIGTNTRYKNNMKSTHACGEYTKRGLMTREQYMRFHLNKQEVRKKCEFWCCRSENGSAYSEVVFMVLILIAKRPSPRVSLGWTGRGSNTQNFKVLVAADEPH